MGLRGSKKRREQRGLSEKVSWQGKNEVYYEEREERELIAEARACRGGEDGISRPGLELFRSVAEGGFTNLG